MKALRGRRSLHPPGLPGRVLPKMPLEPVVAVPDPDGTGDGHCQGLAGGVDGAIGQGLAVGAVGIEAELRVHVLGLEGVGEQDGVLHRHGCVVNSVPEEEGGRLAGDPLLQAHQLRQLLVALPQQVPEGLQVGALPAGDHAVAKHHPVGPVGGGLLPEGAVDLRLVPHQSRAPRQMPPGGEAHGDNGAGVHVVAIAVGADVVDGGQQLALGDGPPALGRHVVVEDKGGVPQPGEAQSHRLPLPVGEGAVAAAGADDEGGTAAVCAQLGEVAGGICNQLRGLIRPGNFEKNGFVEHRSSPFYLSKEGAAGWRGGISQPAGRSPRHGW